MDGVHESRAAAAAARSLRFGDETSVHQLREVLTNGVVVEPEAARQLGNVNGCLGVGEVAEDPVARRVSECASLDLQGDLLFLASPRKEAEAPINVDVTDLTRFLGAEGDGVHWSLPDPGDLNVNLVRLGPGRTMADHTNHELDVVLVVLAGTGRLVVDNVDRHLATAVVARVPKGTPRAIHAGAEGMAYLTVHRRREPLGIGRAGRTRR